MPEVLHLLVNGKEVSVPEGSMVSAAVSLAGCSTFRRSVTGEPRAPLCGMGICYECRVTIDGEPHHRSCHSPCREGIRVETDETLLTEKLDEMAATNVSRRECDVLVVGAGPAGIAAAWAASQSGARVLVIDDNQARGGQIWRGEDRSKSSPDARAWFDRISNAQIDFLYGARIFDVPQPGKAFAETSTGLLEIHFTKLILATGARERFLPFPGWQMPNVVGAGGLQALVKSGLPIKGKRVVVAGSGPLLLAVAQYLRKHGAKVLCIIEQASRRRIARFAVGLLSSPKKGLQALGLFRQLNGIPVEYGSWITAAEGNEKLERVSIRNGNGRNGNGRNGNGRNGPGIRTMECDYLAIGFHLVPNLEVASQIGCELSHEGVVVDSTQETSVADIFSAGETSGIGGLELALVEGQIAGYAATGNKDFARRLFAERSRARRFAQRLNSTFAPRDELRQLPANETVVCRCEDVTWKQITEHDSWRSAKLHTRCGMGPCQGRVCGAALNFLLDWNVESVRPPLFPVRIESLANTE